MPPRAVVTPENLSADFVIDLMAPDGRPVRLNLSSAFLRDPDTGMISMTDATAGVISTINGLLNTAAVTASEQTAAAMSAAAGVLAAAQLAAGNLLAEAEAAIANAALNVGFSVDTMADLPDILPSELDVGKFVQVRSNGKSFLRVSSGGNLDFTGGGGVMLLTQGRLDFFDFLTDYTDADRVQIALGTFTGDLAVPLAAFHAALVAQGASGVGRPHGYIPWCVIRSSAAPNFAINHLKLDTEGWVEFRGIGNAVGFSVDGMGKGYNFYGAFGMDVGPVVASSETGPVGIYIRRAQFSNFRGLNSRGGALVGVLVDGCVCTNFFGVWVTQHAGDDLVQIPAKGLLVTGTAWQPGDFDPLDPFVGWKSISFTSWSKFHQPVTEDAQIGIELDYTYGVTVDCGTSERSTNIGLSITQNALYYKIRGTDFEANTNYDIYCLGGDGLFDGVDSGSTAFFGGAAAKKNKIIGGHFNQLTFDALTSLNSVSDASVVTRTDLSTGPNRNRWRNIAGASAWLDGWIASAPVVTASSGALTSYLSFLEYKIVDGNTVHVQMSVQITDNGTGSVSLLFNLPVEITPALNITLSGTETQMTGKGVTGVVVSATQSVSIRFADLATYPGATGANIDLQGTYRMA